MKKKPSKFPFYKETPDRFRAAQWAESSAPDRGAVRWCVVDEDNGQRYKLASREDAMKVAEALNGCQCCRHWRSACMSSQLETPGIGCRETTCCGCGDCE